MVQLETFDKYLLFSRDQALNQFLDEKNYRIFKVILWILTGVCSILLIVNIADAGNFNFSLFLVIINLLFIITLLLFYKKFFTVNNIRRFILIFLIYQFVSFTFIDYSYPHTEDDEEKTEQLQNKPPKPGKVKSDTITKFGMKFSVKEDDDSISSNFVIFIMLMLFFRFSRTEMFQLFIVSVIILLFSLFFLNTESDTGEFIANISIGVLLFVIALASEKKRQRKFYEQYDFYHKKNYENVRMKKELNYAREIQLSMLPKNNALIGDIEISAISVPAYEVGGDYFDYFKISETQVGVFICDVSGHGVASGLMLSALRSCMHLILEDNSNPKEVLNKLNRMIRKTQSRKMFVTAILAVIDLEKNKCTLFNAGHLPPYRISGESGEIFKIKKHGLALGAMNIVEKSDSDSVVVFDFKKNDKLILYTDGVNEAMNQSKTEYGLDNLELFLNNNAEQSASDLLNGLLDDVKKFINDSIQRDDLTLLIIKRN